MTTADDAECVTAITEILAIFDDDPLMTGDLLSVEDDQHTAESRALVTIREICRRVLVRAGDSVTGATRPDIPAAPVPSETATGPSVPVSEAAVQVALARRVDLLSDRPDPMVLSEETLTRLMLEAAAPLIRAEAEAKLDEIRRIIAAFFAHHGNSAAFALQSARDLGEGIRQVLDRTALGALGGGEKQERSDEKEPS